MRLDRPLESPPLTRTRVYHQPTARVEQENTKMPGQVEAQWQDVVIRFKTHKQTTKNKTALVKDTDFENSLHEC